MAAAESSFQPTGRKGKKPVSEQESHIVFPPGLRLYGQPRCHITTNTTPTKVASKFPPTGFQNPRTDFDNDGIDSGISDLDFEPTRHHRGSKWKNLTARTEAGEALLSVPGDMRLVDGYILVGQELGLLNLPGALPGESEAQLAASLQIQTDESERLNTKKEEVTRERNEAEKKVIDLADRLRKVNAENESHGEEVQILNEEFDKLRTSLQEGVGTLEAQVQHAQMDKTLLQERVSTLEAQVQHAQTDKTLLQERVSTLEAQVQHAQTDKTLLQERIGTLEEKVDLLHRLLNITLDQPSLDHALRDEEIRSLCKDNDRGKEQVEELVEQIYVLYVAYTESETDLDHFQALSEHVQRSSLPTHNEVPRPQRRSSEMALTMIRKKGRKFGVIAKDGEVKWLRRPSVGQSRHGSRYGRGKRRSRRGGIFWAGGQIHG
ncbi:hypothetical protein BKA65DRAFT_226959 [Rhexocercosporidium sp. MPI-PUGE-AT-0058]|nr:hypothetical protein BKA65DRAFT_226959 [Rhexocercosporidium sp. MPI-PUGE-AT-0058]